MPRSSRWRSSRPSPCSSVRIASGTCSDANGSPPRAVMASSRAATIGSPGEANGSLSMITQLSASPTTSTPCQKLEVANSTAFGVRLNVSSSTPRGAVPCVSIG